MITGPLYGLGSTSRLYVINSTNGVARQIGAGAFTAAINGTAATSDFNPTVDRIRLVSNTGQNLRLNPETGTVAATDGSINGVPSAAISAVAYSNSVAGANSTVLYDIDPSTDMLYRQDPPNNGTLVAVGALGANTTAVNGFDIGSTSGTAFAVLTVSTTASVYTINLTSGVATKGADLPKPLTAMTVGLGF